MSRRSALALAAALASGCAPVTTGGPAGSQSEINQAPPSPAAAAAWADSVLATLTLREKAAQIVWPSVFGDYASGNSAQWQRLTAYVGGEKVGGFTISVGSPTEMAAKLNALQTMSRCCSVRISKPGQGFAHGAAISSRTQSTLAGR